MKQVLFLVLVLLTTFNVQGSEVRFGLGNIWNADQKSQRMSLLSYKEGKTEFSWSNFETYSETTYIDDPNFSVNWPLSWVKSHNVFAVTHEIFTYNIVEDVVLFIDFGVSYTDHKSNQLSSNLNFKTKVGFVYKEDRRCYSQHDSNASLTGENGGEDSFVCDFIIYKF